MSIIIDGQGFLVTRSDTHFVMIPAMQSWAEKVLKCRDLLAQMSEPMTEMATWISNDASNPVFWVTIQVKLNFPSCGKFDEKQTHTIYPFVFGIDIGQYFCLFVFLLLTTHFNPEVFFYFAYHSLYDYRKLFFL